MKITYQFVGLNPIFRRFKTEKGFKCLGVNFWGHVFILKWRKLK
jgi:hypothetical protein